jgi:general secretion pathway protein J
MIALRQSTASNGERGCDAGITLIEMLVSLVIFGFVGLASFTMLDTLLKVRSGTDGRLEAVAQIDRALTVFSRDFAQGDPAGVRLEDGVLSVLFAPNQRHSYAAKDRAFSRAIGPEIGTELPLSQSLIPLVQDITFAVLDTSNTWQSEWPSDDETIAPRAVRLVLNLDESRSVTRLVALTDVVFP